VLEILFKRFVRRDKTHQGSRKLHFERVGKQKYFMKKLLLSAAVLTLFSISLLIFQISCKKDAIAQSPTSCSELATVNITVTIPVGKSVFLSDRIDNNIMLQRKLDQNCTTFNSCQYNSDGYYIEYGLDFRAMGTSNTKIFVFKNIIPGLYYYDVDYVYYHVGAVKKACSTVKKEITLVAGQTYNLTISASEFTCQ
jgi:hypothetical protein